MTSMAAIMCRRCRHARNVLQSIQTGSKTTVGNLSVGYSTTPTSQPSSRANAGDVGMRRDTQQNTPFGERSFVRKRFRHPMLIPRYTRMREDQDWSSVWPTAATFKPSVVPLPLRMGYPMKGGVEPSKFGNTELMKIPNFLHLTPPAIEKHCEAIKKFCTPWPDVLETDEICEEHFPLEITSSDYCHSGASIRHPDARIVTTKIRLSNLELDTHARRKLIKLVGDKYDPSTDTVMLTTDRCPLRGQNEDYGQYLLTVLFFESWKHEPWESEKTEEDMEVYEWESRQSGRNLAALLKRILETEHELKTNPQLPPIRTDTSSSEPAWSHDSEKTSGGVTFHDDVLTAEGEVDMDRLLTVSDVAGLKSAVESLQNDGENPNNLDDYKRSVLKVLLGSRVEDVWQSVGIELYK